MADNGPACAGWIGVLGSPQMWAQAPATLYAEELLAQAGVLNWRWIASADELSDPSVRVALIPNARLLSGGDLPAVRGFVEGGGGLLALGRPGPLAELLDLRAQPPIREGWLVPGAALSGRMRDPWQSMASAGGSASSGLHVFDVVHLLGGDAAAAPLSFSVGNHHVNWPVSHAADLGAGRVILIAADVLGSIVRIQQGLAIHRNGQPAPDGSAPIDDGILRCNDSIMLDWTRDRHKPVEALPPIFLVPQCDVLRELLVAALLDLAERARLLVPVLDCWPGGLPAVGLISHDSDGNDAAQFDRQLAADDQAGIRATWCCLSGTEDGRRSEYPAELLARVAASGHELALHYDAFSDHPACRWGQPTLHAQLTRLRQRMRAVGIDSPVYSNKNHYTRWEGRLDFFRWLLAEGVRVDQSKGPSKAGCCGWPFGSCHPWRPIDDEVSPPHLMDLLEVPLATQDLGEARFPTAFGRCYIDAAVARGGVAHLLFHPAHIDKPEVRACLSDVVAYARGKGIQWWTSRQIGQWQFARRAIRLLDARLDAGRLMLNLDSPKPLAGATLRVDGASRGSAGPADLAGRSETPVHLA